MSCMILSELNELDKLRSSHSLVVYRDHAAPLPSPHFCFFPKGPSIFIMIVLIPDNETLTPKKFLDICVSGIQRDSNFKIFQGVPIP